MHHLNDAIGLMCAWCIDCISHPLCKIVCYTFRCIPCRWMEISFPKNLHYSNWIVLWMHWIFCHIMIYFCHSMATRVLCMHRSWETFNSNVEHAPVSNGIFYLNLLCDFLSYNVDDVRANISTLFTLNQFNHLVYIPNFNWFFSHSIFICQSIYSLDNSINNKIIRAHFFFTV